MRSRYDDFVKRARRRKIEDAQAAAALEALAGLAPGPRRELLRAHATAGMVSALAARARLTGDLSLLDDAEEIAAALSDLYDGPHARFVVWSARGAVLHAGRRFAEALPAFDRAGAELDAAPHAFAAAFRADLALDRAALLLDMGDRAAARASAWSAAGWVRDTGERDALARIAAIVT